MKRSNFWLVLILIVPISLLLLLLLLLYRGTRTSNAPVKIEPAKVVSVPGTDFKQVTLTAKAAERLGIKTVTIREERVARSGSIQKVVPYASVIYDLQGETWVYTNPQPLVFARDPIIIDYIDGDLAILSKGPPQGAQVVIVGVAELYGIETGIGK